MSRSRVFLIALAVACLLPAPARADVGLGVRLAWVRPDVEQDTGTNRYTGGMLRARLSPRTAIELSLDWRSVENEAGTLRTRERPFQGTLLLHLMSGGFAPYLLGGVGWYNTKVETLGADEKVLETASDTTFGYHAGFGGEIRAGRRVGIHVDYRYKFIRTDDEVDSGVPVVGGIIDTLGLSRSGSMWTGGITFYF